MVMAAAGGTRKRPAPEGCPAAAGGKRARYWFRSIYNYERLEVPLLGNGTYGVVVKARERRTRETVAVKWIRPSTAYDVDGRGPPDLRAAVREARCLAAYRGHPSIVQFKEVAADEVTRHVFIVMEFVGPSLESRLQRPFSVAETRAIMRQLLAGAEKIHGTGMIHRDIKPDNILIGPGGAIKICDLGMAAPTRPAGIPYPEKVVGALWYRAPELLKGSRSYGPAVDMWALGCVMGELLNGEPLFKHAETEDDMLARIRDLQYEMESTELQAFECLPELSEAGREVLRGLLSFEPEKRLTAAEALSHKWFAEEDDASLCSCAALYSQQDRRRFINFL